jgi:hypothetical protein
MKGQIKKIHERNTDEDAQKERAHKRNTDEKAQKKEQRRVIQMKEKRR